MKPDIQRSAVFDNLWAYRYHLRRTWNPLLQAKRCVWVMLNPSTADGEEDDPTIRRCMGFARRWGFGGIDVVNLFAYRATDPATLRRILDPVGPCNDWWIEKILGDPDTGRVVAAWGANGDLFPDRVDAVRELLAGRAVCFAGLTIGGQPRHPLYVSNIAQIVPLEEKEPV